MDNQAKSSTSEYFSWNNAVQRCLNPKNEAYKHYGGRGIKMCDRWLFCYDNFLLDMGKKPSQDHSLDRIDVNGDYEPINCRWATRKEQATNKRNTVFLTLNGEKLHILDWSKKTGIPRSVLQQRYNKGWNADRILSKTRYGHPRANKVCLVINWS